MSSYLALPRTAGHSEQLYHDVFDPSEPEIDLSQFLERKDWDSSEFGGDLHQELPPNAPTPRDRGFTLRAFVDADHADDTIT
jgi:hypothetical protein